MRLQPSGLPGGFLLPNRQRFYLDFDLMVAVGASEHERVPLLFRPRLPESIRASPACVSPTTDHASARATTSGPLSPNKGEVVKRRSGLDSNQRPGGFTATNHRYRSLLCPTELPQLQTHQPGGMSLARGAPANSQTPSYRRHNRPK